MTNVSIRISQRLDRLFQDGVPKILAVAVSGGGDSLALLHLLHSWAAPRSVRLMAVTVDHGLRDNSRQEAEFVARKCAKLGLPHEILTWTGWDRQGNLQDRARQARRGLIEKWCDGLGITAVLTGHTADDQAETVLMRLARGSGVDGLAGMREVEQHGVLWLRPLLDERREVLRDYLRGVGVDWVEDPSNDDLRFDRIRARQMLNQLGDLGLTVDRLIQTADHMQAAQNSLWAASVAFAKAHVIEDRGDLIVSREALVLDRGDTERRVFAAAIGWVSSALHRPRFAALQGAATQLRDGKRTTLNGVLMTPEAGTIRFSREPSAVVHQQTAIVDAKGETVWDQRWHIRNARKTEVSDDLFVRCLGEVGLTQCPDWREIGLARASLMSSPAIWSQDRLIAAPVAGVGNGWGAYIPTNFVDSLLSH